MSRPTTVLQGYWEGVGQCQPWRVNLAEFKTIRFDLVSVDLDSEDIVMYERKEEEMGRESREGNDSFRTAVLEVVDLDLGGYSCL